MDFTPIKLDSSITRKPFCCSDADLNGFFEEDALKYTNQLLTVTYLLETSDSTVAYFSLLNDKISLKDYQSQWRNLFNRKLPNSKRTNNYPAVKIGRLAVSESFENKGVGTQILDFLKYLFTTNNRTGCRYLTVDAYRSALGFYEKNGFDYLTEDDRNEDTRLMYYDLKKFVTFHNKSD